MRLKIGEEFRPDQRMKKLFFTYLGLVVIPLLSIGLILVTYLVQIGEHSSATIFAIFYFLPLAAITIFVSYWIPKYYESIRYTLTESEVRVERGVWWKMRHAVPFSRVMSVDAIQGPISRRFGIGTVDIHTAGYTGRAGGGGGPSTRRAEASIMHVSNFLELREGILEVVKGKALFGTPYVPTENLMRQMLDELKEIRKLLSDKLS